MSDPVAQFELQLSFKVDSMADWDKGTDFFNEYLEALGWELDAAGTGGGERDMQFSRGTAPTDDEMEALQAAAKAAGIKLMGLAVDLAVYEDDECIGLVTTAPAAPAATQRSNTMPGMFTRTTNALTGSLEMLNKIRMGGNYTTEEFIDRIRQYEAVRDEAAAKIALSAARAAAVDTVYDTDGDNSDDGDGDESEIVKGS